MASRDGSELEQRLDSIRRRIDTRLSILVPAKSAPPDKLHRAMRYSLLAPGKRIRPIVTVLTAEALGASPDVAVDPACAVEMVHTASLILDDLPVMDDAHQRRGQPASHVAFGQDIATLAAVSLLSRAYAVLTTAPDLAEGRRLALVRELANVIGDDGVVSGQIHDLELTGQTDPCPNELERIARQKTGALFDVCARMGALVAGVSDLRLDAVRDFACNLGLCFQVLDDLADGQVSQATPGGHVAEDHSRATFVSVLGAERAQEFSEQLVHDAVRALEPIGPAADPLAKLAQHVLYSTQRFTPQR